MTGPAAPMVLVPGAWCREQVWSSVAERLRAAGREVHPITLGGLTQAPAAAAGIGLQDHVGDVLDLLATRNLSGATLVGHSYSGLVVGQAADRAPDRVARVVFVQAFLPVEGRSLVDDFGPGAAEEARLIERNGGWWPPPTLDDLTREPDVTPEVARSLHRQLVPHPGRTVLEPVRMTRPHTTLDARYVLGSGAEPPASLKDVPAGHVHRIDAGHFCMVTAPEALTELLLTCG